MRLRATVAIGMSMLLLGGLSGCGSNNKGKIEGTKWSLKEANLKSGKAVPGKLTIEFAADGTTTWTGRDVLKGKYTLGAGDIVTFHFDQEYQGSKSHRETITIDGDTLTLTDKDGTAVFERVTAKDDKKE